MTCNGDGTAKELKNMIREQIFLPAGTQSTTLLLDASLRLIVNHGCSHSPWRHLSPICGAAIALRWFFASVRLNSGVSRQSCRTGSAHSHSSGRREAAPKNNQLKEEPWRRPWRRRRKGGIFWVYGASASTNASPLGVPTPVTLSHPGAVTSDESVPKVMTNQRVEKGLLYSAL